MHWAVWFVLHLFVGSPYQLCYAAEEKNLPLFSLILNCDWLVFCRYRAASFTRPPLKQAVDKAKWLQEISGATRMNCDCEPREPDSLFQKCFLAITTTVKNQRPIWSCARICICVWLLYWEVLYFDLHIPATAASHFHANCCLYPVQFQWDNTVVKQSRIWHTMLIKLYFKLSLCAILIWRLHITNMIVFSQMWLFGAQTYVNAVPQ